MTLLELIRLAMYDLNRGISKEEIINDFEHMNVHKEVIKAIMSCLNDDGSEKKISL
jgi:uncharacterized protein (DUF433 family)